MTTNALLTDAFTRNADLIPSILDGLNPDAIVWQPDPGSNSLGWLLWHATRVEDDHMAGIAEAEQAWPQFKDRFQLPYGDAHGYGMSAADVAKFDVRDAALLDEYYSAVHARTLNILASLQDKDFERIVDRNWDPPVTLGVRVISVLNDVTQHVGQAAYLRGLWERTHGEPSRFNGTGA